MSFLMGMLAGTFAFYVGRWAGLRDGRREGAAAELQRSAKARGLI